MPEGRRTALGRLVSAVARQVVRGIADEPSLVGAGASTGRRRSAARARKLSQSRCRFAAPSPGRVAGRQRRVMFHGSNIGTWRLQATDPSRARPEPSRSTRRNGAAAAHSSRSSRPHIEADRLAEFRYASTRLKAGVRRGAVRGDVVAKTAR